MDDIYEAIIGEGAGKGQRAALIAAALRRRNNMGLLGQITGDKTLAPAGRELTNSSDAYSEMLQQIRQNDNRAAQTKDYQTGQLDHMAAALAETKRNNDMDHEYQMAMAAAAGLKAEKAGTGGKIPKLRQGDIKEMQDLSQTIGAVDDLSKFLEQGGSFGAVKVAGLPVPGARTFKNYAASKGYGNDADKASFLAKQKWDLFYNIAERNRMFGATLTDAEKKSWADANPSVGQTDEQIAKALPIMRKVFDHRLKKKASGLLKEGYSGEALADFTDIPGVNILDPTEGSPTGNEAAPAGKRRLKKVDGKWVDVSGN